VPLDVQPLSVNEEHNDDGRGAGCHDELQTANLNVGESGKSTDKKTNKPSSSLLVRGRHACPTEKKASPSQMTKTKTHDGDPQPSRNSIFVLLD